MRPPEASRAGGKRRNSSRTALLNFSHHSRRVFWAVYCRVGGDSDVYRGGGTRYCGARAVGSGAAFGSIGWSLGRGLRTPRLACPWRVARAGRRTLAHAIPRTDPAACRDVVVHHFPTADSDRRASTLSCRRTHHLRGCEGGAVHVSTCGGAGGDASGDAAAADHPSSGVRSTAPGRGVSETVAFLLTGNRS